MQHKWPIDLATGTTTGDTITIAPVTTTMATAIRITTTTTTTIIVDIIILDITELRDLVITTTATEKEFALADSASIGNTSTLTSRRA